MLFVKNSHHKKKHRIYVRLLFSFTIWLAVTATFCLSCLTHAETSLDSVSEFSQAVDMTDAEVTYQKVHDNYQVIHRRKKNENGIFWQTHLVLPDHTELVLEQYHMDTEEAYPEIVFMPSKLDRHTVSNSFMHHGDVFLIHQNFGKIYITKYEVAGITKDIKRVKKVKRYIQSHIPGSLESNYWFSTLFKEKNQLYVNIGVHSYRIGISQRLFKINLTTFDVKKINFDDKNPKIIKAFSLRDFSKKKHQKRLHDIQGNKHELVEPRLKVQPEFDEFKTQQDIIKPFISQTFNYVQLSSDSDLNYKQNTYLRNLGLRRHTLFTKSSSNKTEFLPLDPDKMKKASVHLNDVLRKYGKYNNERAELIGYINQTNPPYFIYFFYRLPNTPDVKLIRYNKYDKSWRIESYTEKAVIDKYERKPVI